MRMEKKKRNRFLVAWLGLIVLTLVAVLAGAGGLRAGGGRRR